MTLERENMKNERAVVVVKCRLDGGWWSERVMIRIRLKRTVNQEAERH